MSSIPSNRTRRSLARLVLAAALLTAGYSLLSHWKASADAETAPLALGDSISVQYISAGGDHSCGLKQEGGIFCWGSNASGQTNVPVSFPWDMNDDFIQVSAGASHSCGLRDDDSAWCWGANSSGQTTIPAPNDNFTQISSGGQHTCGRKSDSSIVCWGSNSSSQLNVPSPNSGFSRVSAGGSHTCGRRSDGSLVCWGKNSSGQLNVPSPNSGFAQVVAGLSHTCGLKTDGSVVCWGSNASGQANVPSPNTQFAQVSAGDAHTCGFKGDGSIVCWGSNSNGALNVPSPNANFAQVSAGGGHSCGLKLDGRVVCWGDNTHYESDPFSNLSDMFLPITAGRNHTCILRADSSVFCWGNNLYGQSGAPTPNYSFVDISAGDELSCGRKLDGSMVCWGADYENHLTVPSPNANITQISAGSRHACGRRSDGTLACTSDYIWGEPPDNSNFDQVDGGGQHSCGVRNVGGQRRIDCWGHNTFGQTSVPTPNNRWAIVTAGANHSCANKLIPGPILCWGSNSSGQTNAPAYDFIGRLSAGDRHSCALRDIGSLFSGPVVCWGDNTSGQSSVPSPNSNYLHVSAGGSHTCGTRAISWMPRVEEAVCWGDDTYGQSTFALTKFRVPPVNQPPTANDDSYTTLEDTPLSVLASSGVLANDGDPDNDPLSAVEQDPPTVGTLALHPDGSFDYTAIPDACGSDAFTYLARTALADSNTATVNITITCVNDAPSFSASDPPAVGEDAGPQTVAGWAAFTPGPTDESSQNVQQYIVSNVSNPTLFATGPVVNTSGDLSFTTAANVHGSSTFDVQVQDDGGTANGGVDTSPGQTFTITVNAANDPPTAISLGVLIVTEDTPGTVVDLWPYFDDLEDSDLQMTFGVSSYTNPGLFTLVDISGDRNLLLAFQPDQNGTGDVVVRATDTGSLWAESTLAVTVTPVNDPPSFTPGGDVAVPVDAGAYSGAWASDISAGPADETGQTLSFHVSNNNNGLFAAQPVISPSGGLTFTPTSGALGSAQVTVYLMDDGGTADGGVDTSQTATFNISVAPFPTVAEVLANRSGAPIPPGGTIVGRINRLTIRFDMDVDNPTGDASPDDVTNPDNFMLLQAGPNGIHDTPHCAAGLSGDDVGLPSGSVQYDVVEFSAVVAVNDGNALPTGDYWLCVCGTTSITAGGIALGGDGVSSGTDYVLDFSVIVPKSLPDTGFAPGALSALPEQPEARDFRSFDNLWLEIPSQELRTPIVGVPFHEGTWDVTWLGNRAGWLEGSAFPTWSGNSVLTAHAINATGHPGPFSALGALRYGDEVAVHAWRQRYSYEVRASWPETANSTLSVMRHYDQPWLTLLTCRAYDPTSGTYLYRTVVRAVQVDIQDFP